MTNERAIERLKERITDNQEKTLQIFLEQDIEAIEILLNLLEKKDIDIIEAKEANRQLSIELQKKDKIIDLMGEKIFEEGIVWENKEDVKQYFERKVENGN